MTVTFYLRKVRWPLGSQGVGGVALGILDTLTWILGAISVVASILVNSELPWSTGHFLWLTVSLAVTSFALGVFILGCEANTLYYDDEATILTKQRRAVRWFNALGIVALLCIALGLAGSLLVLWA